MVYLAELLVVMTIQPKIIRICAPNVSHVHGQKRLDYNTSCVFLSLQESDSVVFFMSWGTCHVETQKKLVLGQPVHVWQWSLSKKVVATVSPLHFDTKSEQSNSNKSSIR